VRKDLEKISAMPPVQNPEITRGNGQVTRNKPPLGPREESRMFTKAVAKRTSIEGECKPRPDRPGTCFELD